MSDTLNKLQKIIHERKNESPKESYVAKMFKKGDGKICQKIGEEATEVVVAVLSEGREQIIYESADLLFHLSLILAKNDVPIDEVMAEIESRMK